MISRVLVSEASSLITAEIIQHFKEDQIKFIFMWTTEDLVLDIQTLEMHRGTFVFVFNFSPRGRY